MGKKSGAPKETPQQKALADVARTQLADYKQRWKPVQAKLAENIQSAARPESFERKQAAGQASTDNAVQFAQAGAGLDAALTDAGAGPNSSKFKLASTGLGDDQATSRGLGFVAADQAIDDAYLHGLGQLTAVGRGERAGAMSGMSQIADMSGRQAASDAALAASRRAGNARLAGQAVGLGLSAAMPSAGAGPNVPTNYTDPALITSQAGTGMGDGFGIYGET